jgi:hypothetical protein
MKCANANKLHRKFGGTWGTRQVLLVLRSSSHADSKALTGCGTAEAVPFVKRRFPIG